MEKTYIMYIKHKCHCDPAQTYMKSSLFKFDFLKISTLESLMTLMTLISHQLIRDQVYGE